MEAEEHIRLLGGRLTEGRKRIAERIAAGHSVVHEFRIIAQQEGRLQAIRWFAEYPGVLQGATQRALGELSTEMQSCCPWGGW